MIRAGLIIDNNRLSKWELESLKYVKDFVKIELILNCENTKIKRNYFKNFLYYILNFFYIKSDATKKIYLKPNYQNVDCVNFQSNYYQKWQIIPKNIIKKADKKNIKLLIKFGMNLLKITDENKHLHILSFHHGDPRKYRGRPAGFYETFNGEKSIGTMVQILNNNIDKGRILAYCETPLFKFSYYKSLYFLFNNSKFILKKALINYEKNHFLSFEYSKKLFSLPSNYLVICFLNILIIASCKRYFYGLFKLKKWNISYLKFDFENLIKFKKYEIKIENKIQVNNKYYFYADPFFINHNEILCEGLNKKNNLGEILTLNLKTNKISNIINDKKNHYSYPSTIYVNNNELFILPEVASWSYPFLYSIKNKNFIKLLGFEKYKLVDPTYLFYDNTHYIFAGKKDDSLYRLYLFYSKENLYGKYHSHNLNPIVINPSNARMGGNIIKNKNKLYRIGQDASNQYGNGLTINLIENLSPFNYREKEITKIKIKNKLGPHTFNILNDNIVFDYYTEKFNIFAWRTRINRLFKL